MGRLNSYYLSLPEEDRLLVSHLLDMIEICEKSYQPRFSYFLNEHEAVLAESVMVEQKCEAYKLYGGFDGASRKILGVFPPYWEDTENFPISALVFKYREADKLSHRDFLGAFMSKQLKRNVIGDIIIESGRATAFVHASVKDALMFEINKIGSVGVKITEVKDPVVHAENNFTEKSGTVSSLRLDSIVSMAAGISREKSAILIKGGNVSVMYSTEISASRQLSEGDIFSARGYGKFILHSVNGKTKKDRFHITVKKYI